MTRYDLEMAGILNDCDCYITTGWSKYSGRDCGIPSRDCPSDFEFDLLFTRGSRSVRYALEI